MTETYRRTTDLMEAELGDELVGLDVEAGTCFGFNDVATSIWRRLESPKSFEALRDELLKDYAVETAECERDLRELLDDLVSKGLVERGE